MGNANLLPPLARMMGAARGAERQAQGRIGPEELQRMTFGAVRSVVSRFAAAGPTVLVLEDLHWADPTSLRLTSELAELAAGRPLLVLATSQARRGPGGRRLAARRGNTPARAAPAVRGRREALASSLHRRPGRRPGSPRRGARYRRRQPAVPRGAPAPRCWRPGPWSASRARGGCARRQDPQLPQVLERLVRSRVDRLGPAAQEAIRAAAVLGAEFTAALLAAVLGSHAGRARAGPGRAVRQRPRAPRSTPQAAASRSGSATR